MTLFEYLKQSKAIDDEPVLAAQAKKLAGQIMDENIASGGSKYPTADSMWKELLKRAEALESGDSGTSTAPKT